MVNPAVTADKSPVVEPIVATDVLLLVQIPPDVGLVSVSVAPMQIGDVPDIADGSGFTVATMVTKHPVPKI
jgi:hypothetical protein